jgi:hypothetical protein
VFSPDDMLEIRKKSEPVVRDNVLFEIGVFMGGLGIERTFIVEAQKSGRGKARIPTDLQGLLTARIKESMSDDLLLKQVAKISRAINNLGPKDRILFDEIRALRSEIAEREFEVKGTTYVLGDLVRELARSRPTQWARLSLPKPAFSQLKEKHGTEVTDEVYWWLVVLGVLRFKDIETFTSEEGWRWKDSIDFVEWSGRGAALLNEMRNG